MESNLIHRTTCRVCGGKNLEKIINLGEMPPANSFLRKDDLNKPENKFPLVAYFCETCSLLQLLDVVSPKVLFGQYDYMTSASKPLAEHFIKMARDLSGRFNLSKEDLVVEIGGNDGTLLSALVGKHRVLNVEPAKNIAEISKSKGVETLNEFWSVKIADYILKNYGSAKLIVANNVMAHIDDIVDVTRGIKSLMGEGGIFVFEVHWVKNLISNGGFDQIYHEHLCYHSLHDLNYLFNKLGLTIFDVEAVPIHGESLRVFVSKNMKAEESVKRFLDEEEAFGLTKKETFLKFADKIEGGKRNLQSLLTNLKRQGKTIVGYGAPAKGNTLLNYFGVTTDLVKFIIDTTPLKQGAYTPGTKIPILHPDIIKENAPDYFLLLAWNYADAILKKEEPLRKLGVKFIIPVPEPKIA